MYVFHQFAYRTNNVQIVHLFYMVNKNECVYFPFFGNHLYSIYKTFQVYYIMYTYIIYQESLNNINNIYT